MIGTHLRRFIRTRRRLMMLYYLYDDLRSSLRYRLNTIASDSGTTHSALDLDASLAYIEGVFDDYARYAGPEVFRGRAAELGPGDNAGVALLMLQAGCQHVDLADRYYARRDRLRQAAIYKALAGRHPDVGARLQGTDLASAEAFPGLTWHYGPEARGETFFHRGEVYDLIVSRAVLEHLTDPLAALDGMAHALAPGGTLLHEVDLRQHDMFRPPAEDLDWLRHPQALHRWMTRASGRPNRILLRSYRECMAALGLPTVFLVTHLAGVGEVTPHRRWEELPLAMRDASLRYVEARKARLSAPFRTWATEDLCVSGFFMVARKPKVSPN